MKVRKAVFPAAGLGTCRFLPATKAQPKEMLPLVDKPIIQYVVEEAVASGLGTPCPQFPAAPPLSCVIGTLAAHSSSSPLLSLQRMR